MESYLLLAGILFTFASIADATVSINFNIDATYGNGGASICSTSDGETFDKWTNLDRSIDIPIGSKQTENGCTYEVTEMTKDLKYKLAFDNVNEKCCGNYRCYGTTSNKDMKVSVKVSFDNNKCDLTQGIVKGTTDSVKCKIFFCQTSDEHKVIWMKKNSNGVYETVTDSRFSSTKNGSLHVENVQPDDAGTYEVKYETLRTDDKREINVDVYVAPEINATMSPDVYSYLGNPESIKFECKATGNPAPDVEITKDGVSIDYYGQPNRKKENGEGSYSVEFKLQKNDDDKFGTYVCTATNDVKTVTHSFVLGRAVKPSLAIVNATVTGNLDADTTLSCPTTGKPNPVYEWYFKNETLSDDDKYDIKNGVDETGDLVIHDTDNDDIGTYTCYMENIMGNATGYRMINSVEAIDKGARGSEATSVLFSVKVLSALFTLCLAMLLS